MHLYFRVAPPDHALMHARAPAVSAAPALGRSAPAATLVQRACACAGKEEPCTTCSGTVQRAASGAGAGFQSPSTAADALRSPSKGLDTGLRAGMEAGFGYDFSNVRVHVDDRATHDLAARAFTLGNDVVFSSSAWRPETKEGKRLIAHELAHVVQQGGRPAAPQAALEVGAVDDPAERAADAAADRVVAGHRVNVAPLPTHAVRRVPSAREQEIELSKTSPGQFTAYTNPPTVSIYNFAIDHGLLKKEHVKVVHEIQNLLDLSFPGAVKVRVVGHADDTGDGPRNVKLSKLRAREAQGELNRHVESIEAKGDTEPAVANDTVTGRSRNRRVDFIFEVGDLTIEERKKKKRKKKKKKKGEKEEEDEWEWDIPNPCAWSPKLCGIIGVGVVCVFIIPEICLFKIPWPFPWPKWPPWPERKKDKDKPKDPPKPKACPIHVDLPNGDLEVKDYPSLKTVSSSFKMNIDFVNDDTGCMCSCGEYEQLIRGYFETDKKTGGKTWTEIDHPLPGGKLSRTAWQEDAYHHGAAQLPYGHRSNGANPKGDRFEDLMGKADRASGCHYRGSDDPSMKYEDGEQIRFHLEFAGAAVDACDARSKKSSLFRWTVDWPKKAPPPPPPKKQSPPVKTADREPPRMGPARSHSIPLLFDPNTTNISSAAFTYAQSHESRQIGGDALEAMIRLEYNALREWYDREHPVMSADQRQAAYSKLRGWAERRVKAWQLAEKPPPF